MKHIQSGLALKHNLHIKAGNIDVDCRGQIKVLLSNESSIIFHIKTETRIAQLIILQIPEFTVLQVDNISCTKCSKAEFGSTDL